jgi:poly(3-hydroxybutyrate) depolymerase
MRHLVPFFAFAPFAIGCGHLPGDPAPRAGDMTTAPPSTVVPAAGDDTREPADDASPGVDDAAADEVAPSLDDGGAPPVTMLEASTAESLVFDDAGCTHWNGPSLDGTQVAYSQCGGRAQAARGACAPQLKPAGQSRCQVTSTSNRCSHTVSTVGGRPVYWQVPMGPAPAKGWPAVVVFQASTATPGMTWDGDAGAPLGAFNFMKMQALLLDNGFAVIAPTADNNGGWWDTNFPNYEVSGDATFIPTFLAAIASGTFGTIDAAKLYAAGWSSGGFMTSRMAISYPGHFAALAIHSGGYATCTTVCPGPIPALPANHPPTLLLHGALDVAVPVAVARSYFDALTANGTEAEIVVNPNTMHDFLPVAPEEFACWFLQH